MQTYITYDREADVLFVQWAEREPGKTGSRDFGGMRFVEFNEADEPVAIEFLDASQGIDLDGIPQADVILEAIQGLGGMLTSKVHAA